MGAFVLFGLTSLFIMELVIRVYGRLNNWFIKIWPTVKTAIKWLYPRVIRLAKFIWRLIVGVLKLSLPLFKAIFKKFDRGCCKRNYAVYKRVGFANFLIISVIHFTLHAAYATIKLVERGRRARYELLKRGVMLQDQMPGPEMNEEIEHLKRCLHQPDSLPPLRNQDLRNSGIRLLVALVEYNRVAEERGACPLEYLSELILTGDNGPNKTYFDFKLL